MPVNNKNYDIYFLLKTPRDVCQTIRANLVWHASVSSLCSLYAKLHCFGRFAYFVQRGDIYLQPYFERLVKDPFIQVIFNAAICRNFHCDFVSLAVPTQICACKSAAISFD